MQRRKGFARRIARLAELAQFARDLACRLAQAVVQVTQHFARGVEIAVEDPWRFVHVAGRARILRRESVGGWNLGFVADSFTRDECEIEAKQGIRNGRADLAVLPAVEEPDAVRHEPGWIVDGTGRGARAQRRDQQYDRPGRRRFLACIR